MGELSIAGGGGVLVNVTLNARFALPVTSTPTKVGGDDTDKFVPLGLDSPIQQVHATASSSTSLSPGACGADGVEAVPAPVVASPVAVSADGTILQVRVWSPCPNAEPGAAAYVDGIVFVHADQST